jgi:hypothetical protein
MLNASFAQGRERGNYIPFNLLADSRKPIFGALSALIGVGQLRLDPKDVLEALVRLARDQIDLRGGFSLGASGTLAGLYHFSLEPSEGPLDFGMRTGEAFFGTRVFARDSLVRFLPDLFDPSIRFQA